MDAAFWPPGHGLEGEESPRRTSCGWHAVRRRSCAEQPVDPYLGGWSMGARGPRWPGNSRRRHDVPLVILIDCSVPVRGTPRTIDDLESWLLCGRPGPPRAGRPGRPSNACSLDPNRSKWDFRPNDRSRDRRRDRPRRLRRLHGCSGEPAGPGRPSPRCQGRVIFSGGIERTNLMTARRSGTPWQLSA
jgi:hypothetical protein